MLNELVRVRDWNNRLAAYIGNPAGFLERGEHDQHPTPGAVQEFKFCPECGQPLDRVALGLLSYSEAYEIQATSNMVYNEEPQ
uniref:Uncharacterized protein n=1 Tax=Pseudomonas fluorescens (strain SBW25) TaxID=216595 RepID=A0A0G4E4W9_PSEFS|nr:hypothetical protein PQBR57_0333 [Pseudomonas fluorescens SBW25]